MENQTKRWAKWNWIFKNDSFRKLGRSIYILVLYLFYVSNFRTLASNFQFHYIQWVWFGNWILNLIFSKIIEARDIKFDYEHIIYKPHESLKYCFSSSIHRTIFAGTVQLLLPRALFSFTLERSKPCENCSLHVDGSE